MNGTITFFYYDDMRAALEFYERVVGLKVLVLPVTRGVPHVVQPGRQDARVLADSTMLLDVGSERAELALVLREFRKAVACRKLKKGEDEK